MYFFCRQLFPHQTPHISSAALTSFLPSVPPTTIIFLSSQNLFLCYPNHVPLNICRISTYHHFIYLPGIFTSHRTHNNVIYPAIARILIWQGGRLFPISANCHIRHCAYLLLWSLFSSVSTTTVSILPYLHRHHSYFPTSLLENLSAEIYDTPLAWYTHYSASLPPSL